MKLKPLTGQVLIELDRPEHLSPSKLLAIPDHTITPEEQQQRDHYPAPPPLITGTVVEIGAWPKLRNGMMVMPEFGLGAKVFIRPTCGQSLHWETSCKLKMVRTEDVLAVLT